MIPGQNIDHEIHTAFFNQRFDVWLFSARDFLSSNGVDIVRRQIALSSRRCIKSDPHFSHFPAALKKVFFVLDRPSADQKRLTLSLRKHLQIKADQVDF